jgi:hypothetical protein
MREHWHVWCHFLVGNLSNLHSSLHPLLLWPHLMVIPSGPMYVEVEVVDTLLDYNLMLGCYWTYAMTTIIYWTFYVIFFFHEGKIVTMDHLSFSHSDSTTWFGSIVPLTNDDWKYWNWNVFFVDGKFVYPNANLVHSLHSRYLELVHSYSPSAPF